MSPKYRQKAGDNVPGPGQYEFHLKALKTAPNWGFGHEQRGTPMKQLNTDPGNYNPDDYLTKNKSPNYGFGTDKRAKDGKNDGGTCQYGPIEEKPGRFYMGIKLKEKDKMNVPGAGAYDLKEGRKGPSYLMGMKLKKDTRDNSPGPGQYINDTDKLKRSAPKIGFGSSKRLDINKVEKDKTPGPGDYRVPVKVVNVPEYAYKRDEDFKFV
jgi:hypothetical protein